MKLFQPNFAFWKIFSCFLNYLMDVNSSSQQYMNFNVDINGIFEATNQFPTQWPAVLKFLHCYSYTFIETYSFISRQFFPSCLRVKSLALEKRRWLHLSKLNIICKLSYVIKSIICKLNIVSIFIQINTDIKEILHTIKQCEIPWEILMKM